MSTPGSVIHTVESGPDTDTVVRVMPSVQHCSAVAHDDLTPRETVLRRWVIGVAAGMGLLAVLMVARIVTRRSLGSFVPWSFVAAAEAFNEIMDRLNFGSWRWADTTSDIANTLFWPTVICLGIRLRPMLLARDAARVKMPDEG